MKKRTPNKDALRTHVSVSGNVVVTKVTLQESDRLDGGWTKVREDRRPKKRYVYFTVLMEAMPCK